MLKYLGLAVLFAGSLLLPGCSERRHYNPYYGGGGYYSGPYYSGPYYGGSRVYRGDRRAREYRQYRHEQRERMEHYRHEQRERDRDRR